MNACILREYQSHANETFRVMEYANPLVRACMQGPCGSGKSVQIADLLTDNCPQMLVTYRRVLAEQLHQTLTYYGVPHGMRAAGYELNNADKQLCMIQTERVRADKMPPFPGCRRIILDELHALKSQMVLDFIEKYGAEASILGFTATPSEVGHLVDEVIVTSTVPQLVGMGHLVPHIVYGPFTPDMEALDKLKRQVNGDYSAAALAKFMPVKAIFGRVVEHWKDKNPGSWPTILFAPGVPQSLWFAQHLSSYGIPAAHLDCKNIWVDGEFLETNLDNIASLRRRMESGDLAIICNRFILREGVDWPFLKCAILATAFGTRKSYVQSVGRIFRPCEGFDRAVVIDHGGNWLLHPPLDSEIPWDIDTSERILGAERIDDMREGKVDEPIVCPKCFTMRVGGPTCPECGHEHTTRSRWVFQASGKLKEVQGRAYRPRRIRELPNQESLWRGKFLGNKKYYPERTGNQIYNNIARENGWAFIPKDLPGMPRTQRAWYLPCGDLTASDLINGEQFLKGTRT